MFLRRFLAKIDERLLHPVAHVLVSRRGEDDSTRLGEPLEPCGDVDSVTHQIVVRLLHYIAEMNADAEFDALLGRHGPR